jgi:hypothetical protein
MKTQLTLILFVLSTSMTIGCRMSTEPTLQTAESLDEDALQVESLVNDIDDASEDFAVDLESAGLQKITSPGCAVTGDNESELSLTFENQALRNNRVVVNGTTTKTYNNDACSITNDNNSFLREHSLSFSSVYKSGSINTTSSSELNYLNESIGGGATLANTNTGWELNILGNNIEVIGRNGFKQIDIAISSVTPYVITGNLRRAGRTIESGSVKVNHNRAEYTAVWSVNQLVWTADCNCPSQGSLEVDYSGLRIGGASVEFQSCGVATLTTDNGRTKTLKLPRCVK